MSDDFENGDLSWLNSDDEPDSSSDQQDDDIELDWLKDSADDSDALQGEHTGVTGDLPWMADVVDAGRPRETDRTGVTSDLPWMGDAEEQIEKQLEEADDGLLFDDISSADEPSSEESTPSWLQGIDIGSDEEEEETIPIDSSEVPSWLQGLEGLRDDEAEEAAPADSSDAPEWLQSVDTGEDEAEEAAPADSSDAPEWLQSVDTGDDAAEEAAPADSSDAPEWLQSVDMGEEAAEEAAPVDSSDTPEWLQSVDMGDDEDQDDGLFSEEAPREPVPQTGELPDWLGESGEDAPAQPAESPAVEEAPSEEPDWLVDVMSTSQEDVSATEQDSISDEWLTQGEELPETGDLDVSYDEWKDQQEAASAVPDIEDEVPDDLFDMDDEELPDLEGVGDELPDWFLGTEELDTGDEPDWFTEEVAAVEQPAEIVEPAAVETADDFLSEFEFGGDGDEDVEDLFGEVAEDLPDGFDVDVDEDSDALFGEDEAVVETGEDALDDFEFVGDDDLGTLFGEDEASDDLLAELGFTDELKVEQPEEEMDWFADEAPAASDVEEEPDWLEKLTGFEDLAGKVEDPDFDEAMPADTDMLAGMVESDAEEDDIFGAAGDATTAEVDMDSFFEEFDDFEIEASDTPSESVSLDEFFAAEKAAQEEEAELARSERSELSPDAPEWLADVIVADDDDISAAAVIRRQDDRPLDELDDRLHSLRDAGIELPTTAMLTPEEEDVFDTAIPGITGALPPAKIEVDEAGIASTAEVSDEQHEHAAVLQELAGGSAISAQVTEHFVEDEETLIGDADLEGLDLEEVEYVAEKPAVAPKARRRTRRRIRPDRLLVSLMLALAVALPFFLSNLRIGDLPPVEFDTGSERLAVFNHVDGIRAGQLVLVAVEYGPTAAAELDPATTALLRHILLRGGKPVLVGGNPVGLLHAGNILDEIAEDGWALTANRDYYLIRYYAGDIVGLRSFGANPGALLAKDIRGQDTGLSMDSVDDFGLIVVIAERSEDVRVWAEQITPLTDAPMVIATGYSAAPLAEPYVNNTTGISGLLVGYRDAYTYGVMLDNVMGGESFQPTPTEAPPTPTYTPMPPTNTPMPPTATPIPPTPTPAIVTIGIVNAATPVNLRADSNTNSEIVGTARPGDEMLVIGQNEDGSWINVQLADGTEGWVASTLLRFEERLESDGITESTPTPTEIPLTPTEAPPTPTEMPPTPTEVPPTPTPATVTVAIVTAAQAVNVRAEPNGNVISVAQPGQEMLVIGQNEDESWVNLRFADGTEGWIAAFLLRFEEREEEPEGSANVGDADFVAGKSNARMKQAGFARQDDPTPVPESTEEAVVEPEATAESTWEEVSTPPETDGTIISAVDEKQWYGMTLGILASVVIIAAGNLFNILRGLLRRGRE